jgi:hypothetical protein
LNSAIDNSESESTKVFRTIDRYIFEIEEDHGVRTKKTSENGKPGNDIIPDKYSVYEPPPIAKGTYTINCVTTVPYILIEITYISLFLFLH